MFCLNSFLAESRSLSWEMKFGKKESIQKIYKCQTLFLNHLLMTQDLWLQKYPRNSVMVKPAHCLPSFISQLRGAPSRKDASSRDRGSLHCRTSGDQTLHKPFESSSSSTRIAITNNGLSANKQTNSQGVQGNC